MRVLSALVVASLSFPSPGLAFTEGNCDVYVGDPGMSNPFGQTLIFMNQTLAVGMRTHDRLTQTGYDLKTRESHPVSIDATYEILQLVPLSESLRPCAYSTQTKTQYFAALIDVRAAQPVFVTAADIISGGELTQQIQVWGMCKQRSDVSCKE